MKKSAIPGQGKRPGQYESSALIAVIATAIIAAVIVIIVVVKLINLFI